MAKLSVNIGRDSSESLQYVVTSNSLTIAKSISHSYTAGNRSFIIQGSYGTGKSSFIVALQSQFIGITKLFELDQIAEVGLSGWDMMNLVGSPSSIIGQFKDYFQMPDSASQSDVIKTLKERIRESNENNKGLFLAIDEFGKHIEYITRNDERDEFYFLQQLAELFNDANTNSIFLITLHQDFLTYIPSSNSSLRNEWLKVSGRYRVLLFNEPVEQLIFFARAKLRRLRFSTSIKAENYQINQEIGAARLTESYAIADVEQLYEDIFPLDWLSINVLVLALQRYGQNERSLFDFLDSNMENFLKDGFFSVASVYDYLVSNFYSTIYSDQNPFRAQWMAMDKALARSEVFAKKEFSLYHTIIKTVGLVNMFGKNSGLLDDEFLINYVSATSKIEESSAKKAIDILIKNRVVRFFNFKNKINFVEGTDLDLDNELSLVHSEVSQNLDLVESIHQYVSMPVITAKRVSLERGTVRLFEFSLLRDLQSVNLDLDLFDGSIVLCMNPLYQISDILEFSKRNSYPQIFIFFKEQKEFFRITSEIKKLELVRVKYADDFPATRLINAEIQYFISRLNDLVFKNIYNKQSNSSQVQWIINGKIERVKDTKEFNRLLSDLCVRFYPKTPVFISELINRDKLSTPINTARKLLFRKLLSENVYSIDLGFDTNKFPPERAIYNSLIKETGIHRAESGTNAAILTDPFPDSCFSELWEFTDTILKKSSNNAISVNEFYEELSSPTNGFKLKRGFLEFWVSLFLITNKNRYSLYKNGDKYIPYLTEEVYDVIHKSPELFSLKYFESSAEKDVLSDIYKSIWDLDSTLDFTNANFIKTYALFLKLIKSLYSYSQQTKNIKPVSLRIRSAILEAKSPEEALFEKIPDALGFDSSRLSKDGDSELYLEAVSRDLKIALMDLLGSFDALVDRLESVLLDSFGFDVKLEFYTYQQSIRDLLDPINGNLLNKDLNVLLRRLMSPLDDRQSWIVSVFDSVFGRSVKDLKDHEVEVLIADFKFQIRALIDYLDIAAINSGTNDIENYFKYRIMNSRGEVVNSVVNTKAVPGPMAKSLFKDLSKAKLTQNDLEWLFVSLISYRIEKEQN